MPPGRGVADVPKPAKSSTGSTVLEPADFDDLEFIDSTKTQTQASDANTDTPATATPDEGTTVADDTDLSFEANEVEAGDEAGTDDAVPSDQAATNVTGKRDYTGFDQDVAEILSKLPNRVYTKFKDQLQQWKTAAGKVTELEGKLTTLAAEKPRFLAEHPNSYRIAPEYNAALDKLREAKGIGQFWEQQIVAIENGESWQEFNGYGQDGQPVFTTHDAPADGRVDQQAKIAATRAYNRALQQEAQFENAARSIAENYRAFQKDAMGKLAELQTQIFKGLTPEKLTGDDKKYYGALLAKLPGPLADNPLAPALGLAFVQHRKMVMIASKLAEENKKLKGVNGAPAKPRAVPAVGPRGTSTAMLNGKGTGQILDLEEFERQGRDMD